MVRSSLFDVEFERIRHLQLLPLALCVKTSPISGRQHPATFSYDDVDNVVDVDGVVTLWPCVFAERLPNSKKKDIGRNREP
jgi:hypothetical protein